jgi:hypothetical protein
MNRFNKATLLVDEPGAGFLNHQMKRCFRPGAFTPLKTQRSCFMRGKGVVTAACRPSKDDFLRASHKLSKQSQVSNKFVKQLDVAAMHFYILEMSSSCARHFRTHTDVLALDEDIGHGALPGHASKFSLQMATRDGACGTRRNIKKQNPKHSGTWE